MGVVEAVIVVAWVGILLRVVWILLTHKASASVVARASAPLPLPDHSHDPTTDLHKARNPERFSPGFAAARSLPSSYSSRPPVPSPT